MKYFLEKVIHSICILRLLYDKLYYLCPAIEPVTAEG